MEDPSFQVYSVIPPSTGMHNVPPPSTWAYHEMLLLFLLLVLIASSILNRSRLHRLPRDITAYLIDLPFQELYRYGPHIVGWEGVDLPEICARITYHGTRDFWRRNMVECEKIYQGKEEAFLRLCRPMAYLGIVMGTFYGVRQLVATYGESKRNRTDQVVLETYHAFQTLVRLANQQGSRGSKR